MIRAFSLLCKLNSYNLSDKALFDVAMNHLDLVHQTCPYCGSSSNHKIYSSYERSLITLSNGIRKEYFVLIPRIKCHCGHTHAVLPDVLIPYASYSLRFILIVLFHYLNKQHSIDILCNKFQIAKSTLYAWIHLFLEHFSLLLGILHSIDKLCPCAISRIFSYPGLPKAFFDRFGFSFMQAHHLTTFSDTT